jgi:uncharacterized protein YbaP (TraB family)
VRLEDNEHQKLKIKVIKDGTSVQALFETIAKIYINNDISANDLLLKIVSK